MLSSVRPGQPRTRSFGYERYSSLPSETLRTAVGRSICPAGASTAPKSIDLKRLVHNLPRIAKPKEKPARLSQQARTGADPILTKQRMTILFFQIGLIVLASQFHSTPANAQFTIRQCSALLEQLSRAMAANSVKQIISVERQHLSYCEEHMQPGEYEVHLSSLADGLNNDNQHQDALGVANRCLQVDATHLPCLSAKASALYSLGRYREAKSVIEKSGALGSVTELDASAQQKLRRLATKVEAMSREQPAVARTDGDATPSVRSRELPAGVSGSVSCAGSSVGLNLGINGELTAATVEIIRKLSDQYNQLEQKVASGMKCDKSALELSAQGYLVEVNSVGGSINAAMAIGKLFRTYRASLQVNGVCFSACVLMLAGAVDRRVGVSNQVGIHRPYFGSTPGTPVKSDQVKDAYLRMLKDMRDYLGDMNVPQRLADDMLAVEPENNRILTQAELKSYRLVGVDPAEQQVRVIAKETMAVQEASQLNIDRQEYMRRKALLSKCSKDDSHCREEVMRTGKEPVLDLSQFGTPLK
jgi:ATP-dependent protease ClpP protease subunit